MRIAMSILLFIHGFAHLVGFLVSWKIATFTEMPYKTTIFYGRINAGDAGIRFWGLLWVLGALMFFLAGIALIEFLPWWKPVTLSAALFSLLISVAGLPESHIGIYVNLLILAILIFESSLF